MAKVKRYRVHGEATVSASMVVEATSKKAAIEHAEQYGFNQLCHHCIQESEDGFSTELDGTVHALEAEEIGDE